VSIRVSVGLYVHVPFCARKCAYCDFNSYASMDELIEPYVRALRWEMEQRSREVGQVATIYIGGGTPSHLPQGSLENVLCQVFQVFDVDGDAEITVEANPADLDIRRMRALRNAGVNRVSIGAQSFDDGVLRFLGRRHDANQARRAVEIARAAGFENVSIDLIYAVPGQSPGMWRQTLEEALALCPDHISAYSLTIEPGTPLGDLVQRGLVAPVDNDTEAEMYEIARGMLEAAGYEHYEISNFARAGFSCRHNQTYWQDNDYVGVGAGAHSYLNGVRWWNVKHPEAYVRMVRGGTLPVAGAEHLSRDEQLREALVLALRTRDGVVVEALEQRFGRELWQSHRKKIIGEMENGLLCIRDGRLALVRDAFVIADAVCEALV